MGSTDTLSQQGSSTSFSAFSNSHAIANGTGNGNGNGAGTAAQGSLGGPSTSHGLSSLTSPGGTSMQSGTGGGLPGFPANFASTGPAFLEHDPFANTGMGAFGGGSGGGGGGGASSRQRTLSAASSNYQQQQQQWGGAPQSFGSGAPFQGSNALSGMGRSGHTGGFANNGPSTYGHQQRSSISDPQSQQQQQQQHSHQQQSGGNSTDDVIPTAIVVKNIPFSFPSSSLMQIIEELTLSPPYAFNYHYDNGNFRGLAFANFHTPQETDACVAALNGFEIAGRKLRVEYKKVLQAGEKERIERDKAIKRMRSMQLERERIINHQQMHAQQHQHQHQHQHQAQHHHMQPTHLMYGAGSAPGQAQGGSNALHQALAAQHQFQLPSGNHQGSAMLNGSGNEDFEDYGRQIHPSNSFFSPQVASLPAPPPFGGSFLSQLHLDPQQQQLLPHQIQLQQQQQQQQQYQPNQQVGMSSGASTSSRGPANGSTSGGSALPYELDMNDPVTLELYSRVLLFKDDALRDELAFSRSLTPLQRRVVHLVAQKLGLEHRSVGTGEERTVVVIKPPSSTGDAGGEHRALRTRASAHHLHLSPDAYMLGGGNGMNPLVASAALRKKSMPDLRHQQAHPSSAASGTPPINTSTHNGLHGVPFGGSASPPLPSGSSGGSGTGSASGVATRHSNHDLRRPRSAFYGSADFSIPPVPALPANLPALAAGGSSGAGGPSEASPRLANRSSMLFGQLQLQQQPQSQSQSQPQSALDAFVEADFVNKAVGSPVSAGALRQPRGPDGSNTWARGAPMSSGNAL